jgi:hypothetical protein
MLLRDKDCSEVNQRDLVASWARLMLYSHLDNDGDDDKIIIIIIVASIIAHLRLLKSNKNNKKASRHVYQ